MSFCCLNNVVVIHHCVCLPMCRALWWLGCYMTTCSFNYLLFHTITHRVTTCWVMTCHVMWHVMYSFHYSIYFSGYLINRYTGVRNVFSSPWISTTGRHKLVLSQRNQQKTQNLHHPSYIPCVWRNDSTLSSSAVLTVIGCAMGCTLSDWGYLQIHYYQKTSRFLTW